MTEGAVGYEYGVRSVRDLCQRHCQPFPDRHRRASLAGPLRSGRREGPIGSWKHAVCVLDADGRVLGERECEHGGAGVTAKVAECLLALGSDAAAVAARTLSVHCQQVGEKRVDGGEVYALRGGSLAHATAASLPWRGRTRHPYGASSTSGTGVSSRQRGRRRLWSWLWAAWGHSAQPTPLQGSSLGWVRDDHVADGRRGCV